MMQLVISCDYLVSPAFCSPELISTCVESLIAIRRDMDGRLNEFLIEENATLQLSEMDCYPCAQIFNHNLLNLEGHEYSGKDIARTVTNILLQEFDEGHSFPTFAADWSGCVLTPPIDRDHNHRRSALLELFKTISLSMEFFKKNYSMLHHPATPDRIVTFSGEITSILPEVVEDLPRQLEVEIPLFIDYREFISSKSARQLYDTAQNEAELRNAFYTGAIAIAVQRNLKKIPKWEDFSLGPYFLKSLTDNLCGPKQEFAGPTFEVICHLLNGIGKNALEKFWTDTTRTEQRSRKPNNDLAWRTHITTGNPALRLMYWTDPTGNIELANVGKKKDLEIL